VSKAYAFGFYKSALVARADKLRWQFCSKGIPYDPFEIAEGLGVKVRIESLQGVDGYTESKGLDTCAVIDSGASETRKRFTLAHELGHVMLFQIAQTGLPLGFKRYRTSSQAGYDSQDPAEEALCNEFAAALLMPEEEVKEKVDKQRIVPRLILDIASLFGVSMHASAKATSQFDWCRACGCVLLAGTQW
jgi:Zn-dependent peptidase ImmA (M78 family)